MEIIPGILLPPELVRESFSEEERLKMKGKESCCAELRVFPGRELSIYDSGRRWYVRSN